MEKRMIAAIALTLLILFGFQMFGPKKAQRTQQGAPTTTAVAPVGEAATAVPAQIPGPTSAQRRVVDRFHRAGGWRRFGDSWQLA